MSTITIHCDNVTTTTRHYDNQITVELINPDTQFISDLKVEDIVSSVDNEKLFNALVENDDEILHNYFKKSGYFSDKHIIDKKLCEYKGKTYIELSRNAKIKQDNGFDIKWVDAVLYTNTIDDTLFMRSAKEFDSKFEEVE